MKNIFAAGFLTIISLTTTGAQAREAARAGADIINTEFNSQLGQLQTVDMNALLASQVCVYRTFLDWTDAFKTALINTPNLVHSDIAQVTTLLDTEVTAREHIELLRAAFKTDEADAVAGVDQAIETARSNGTLPPRAADQGLVLSDVKQTAQRDAYKKCSSTAFVDPAKTNFTPSFLTAKINSHTVSVNPVGVKLGTALGKVVIDTSSFGISFTPAKLTREEVLLLGLYPN